MVNDVNIYIKVMLDLGYQIGSSGVKKILFTKKSYYPYSLSQWMEKNVELYLDKPGGLFMVSYSDDYYSGRHIGETEFINMNRDRIRDIKIDLCC